MSPEIADAFNEVARQYCHAKQQGVPMAAAMLMFLEATPEYQAAKIKEVLGAEVDETAERLVEAARDRQAQAVQGREPPKRTERGTSGGRKAG